MNADPQPGGRKLLKDWTALELAAEISKRIEAMRKAHDDIQRMTTEVAVLSGMLYSKAKDNEPGKSGS